MKRKKEKILYVFTALLLMIVAVMIMAADGEGILSDEFLQSNTFLLPIGK